MSASSIHPLTAFSHLTLHPVSFPRPGLYSERLPSPHFPAMRDSVRRATGTLAPTMNSNATAESFHVCCRVLVCVFVCIVFFSLSLSIRSFPLTLLLPSARPSVKCFRLFYLHCCLCKCTRHLCMLPEAAAPSVPLCCMPHSRKGCGYCATAALLRINADETKGGERPCVNAWKCGASC